MWSLYNDSLELSKNWYQRSNRIVSHILQKIPEKKQRIKLSNLFQIKIKNKNFEIKTDFFKQILQSRIFLFLFLKRSRRIEVVYYVYYWSTLRRDLFKNKNKKILLCSICLKKSVFISKFLFFIFIRNKFDSLIRCFFFPKFLKNIRFDSIRYDTIRYEFFESSRESLYLKLLKYRRKISFNISL